MIGAHVPTRSLLYSGLEISTLVLSGFVLLSFLKLDTLCMHSCNDVPTLVYWLSAIARGHQSTIVQSKPMTRLRAFRVPIEMRH